MKNNKDNIQCCELPAWVKWIAQDKDGAWWGYSVEPLEQSNGWYENEVGQLLKIKQASANPDWKNTLTKVTLN